jgi:hypothetical protein
VPCEQGLKMASPIAFVDWYIICACIYFPHMVLMVVVNRRAFLLQRIFIFDYS